MPVAPVPYCRYDGSQIATRWEPSILPPGQMMNKPAALYQKLDSGIVEEERERLRERLGLD